jgi:DnaJ-domain-containing protein 1
MPRHPVPAQPQADLSHLQWTTPELVASSLDEVARQTLAGRIHPAVAKSVASTAAMSLRALGLSVRAEIQELKAQYRRLEQEQKGPGRRKGTGG